MNDQQFAEFCAKHPDRFFEMTAAGEIIVMPPTFSYTSMPGGEISRQLAQWALEDGRGVVCQSSGGFVLPNGARRSPDASWVATGQLRQLSRESLREYWHLCPAFITELRSQSDRLPALRAKMREYTANGAELGWLVDPESRTVAVYRGDSEPENIQRIFIARRRSGGGFRSESPKGLGPARGLMFG